MLVSATVDRPNYIWRRFKCGLFARRRYTRWGCDNIIFNEATDDCRSITGMHQPSLVHISDSRLQELKLLRRPWAKYNILYNWPLRKIKSFVRLTNTGITLTDQNTLYDIVYIRHLGLPPTPMETLYMLCHSVFDSQDYRSTREGGILEDLFILHGHKECKPRLSHLSKGQCLIYL